MFRYHYDLLGRLTHFNEDMATLFRAVDLGEYKEKHANNLGWFAKTNETIVRRMRHQTTPCLISSLPVWLFLS